MLQLNGENFSSGRATFHDSPPANPDRSARVYVKVAVDGMEEPFLALLDTGAEWSVLDPEIAGESGLAEVDGQEITMEHRHGRTAGKLVRARLTMLADEGDGLDVEATVFVPVEHWPTGRNFIGYLGFLERIRVALDPQSRDLYFGASDEPVGVGVQP